LSGCQAHSPIPEGNKKSKSDISQDGQTDPRVCGCRLDKLSWRLPIVHGLRTCARWMPTDLGITKAAHGDSSTETEYMILRGYWNRLYYRSNTHFVLFYFLCFSYTEKSFSRI